MSKIDELCRFNDFTFLNYESLLELAKQKYKFVTFDENQNFKNKIILLRHDVEFSVPIALKMARIETSLGIRATYFVQLHGDFYNALEKETFQNLKQIESLGHKLALHFDPHFWNITDEKQLEEYLLIDKTTFEQYFNVAPIAFSFHNNNSFTLSCEKELYAGILNVYSKKIKEEVGYCTDSTGFWRYEILEHKLKKANDNILQVLIHDGMWQDVVLPPRRRIYKVIDDHAKYMKCSYDQTLKKYGAKNIDWEGEV